jgi:hypothetical protein
MKISRKTSKNLRHAAIDNELTSTPGDNVNSDNLTILPSVQPTLSLCEPSTGRVMRSRRNTFTYGQAGEGSSSQFPTPHDSPALSPSYIYSHHELVPYSKEWTVIL